LIDVITMDSGEGGRGEKRAHEEWLIKMKPYINAFNCYSCGAKDNNMILCKNESDPNRNDNYGKDGYTNCC